MDAIGYAQQEASNLDIYEIQ